MRFVGIDFGEKRVGLALSSENNRLAFPKLVLANDKALVRTIADFCQKNNVAGIVLGESTDYQGKANKIMKKALAFKKEIEKVAGLPVYLEPEFLTSQEAMRIQGENSKIDASSAAIILQSFLSRQ